MTGLAALASRSESAYVAAATEMAANRQRLGELRPRLRAAVAASPLCDRARFSENIGRMLGEIWRRYCAGETAVSFSVADIRR